HLLDEGFGAAKTEPVMSPGSIDGYIDSVVESIEGRGFSGMRVVLDCANGAASATAARVFGRLDADAVTVADTPDGRNINDGVGSNHPEHVAAVVAKERVSVGFAFDGDADRVVGCGFDGSIIDGDQILAMAAIDRHDHGDLPQDTLVTTVMANLGLRVAMRDAGITIVETPVGDRNVLEALDRGGFALGGEQSGHIIYRDLATTGDGVLTAVQLLDASVRRGVELGDWAASVMTRYPQVLHNVPVDRRMEHLDARLDEAVTAERAALGADGRILIRPSGTEPLVRVMVEAADVDTAEATAMRLGRVVEALTSEAP
ncbi:MAG: phosphoglucosamine mutase, partial [Acidimicrobiia bacterium]|nr:phosphoglucosamine mutase [Acidimicrobiia bacterium]